VLQLTVRQLADSIPSPTATPPFLTEAFFISNIQQRKINIDVPCSLVLSLFDIIKPFS
jgi:hypothetical protein